MPGFVEPMLATLAKSPPAGDRWLHEIKFDGYRLQARIEDGRVTLWTRSGLDWTEKFGGAVPEALRDLPVRNALIDGELVVENESGASEFSLLQADLSEGRHDRFVYYAFDCLYLDGYDLREAPLIRRKALLSRLIGTGAAPSATAPTSRRTAGWCCSAPARSVSRASSRSSAAPPIRPAAARAGSNANARPGRSSSSPAIVPSTTGRKAIGSLVLGVYDGDALRYVGRVGTGFSAGVAEALFAQLEPMRIPSSPFAARLSGNEARRFVSFGPSWRRKSISAPGPPTASCARPLSRACARTSRRARLSASRP